MNTLVSFLQRLKNRGLIFIYLNIYIKSYIYTVLLNKSTIINNDEKISYKVMKKKINKQELISIIIPTYNNEKTIEKAINSVLKQDYKNIEVLVIDDGSIDLTKKVIKNINDSRISYFYKKNTGLGYTRNFGLDNARGEYIYFLDGDDELLPHALSSLYYPSIYFGIDIISGKTIRYYKNIEKSHTTWHNDLFVKSKIIEINAKSFRDTLVTNKLLKKSFLLQNNLYFVDQNYEDKIYTSKMYNMTSKIGYINKYIYVWNIFNNNKSITNRMTINDFHERTSAIKKSIFIQNKIEYKDELIKLFLEHDLLVYIKEFDKFSQLERKTIYKISLEIINIQESFKKNYQIKVGNNYINYLLNEEQEEFICINSNKKK